MEYTTNCTCTSAAAHQLFDNTTYGQVTNMTNGTMESEQFISIIKHPINVIIIYAIAYGMVFLFALFGNLVVVAVVWRNRYMHTITNFFIVNLAVADILVAIFCVPITLLTNIFEGWPYGAVLCKVTPYLQGVSVCASVNTLAAIAVDRYIAICYSMNYRLNSTVAKGVMTGIWIFALSIMSPWAVFYQHERLSQSVQVIHLCLLKWPSVESGKVFFLAGIFLFCYTIPLFLIVICYSLIGIRVWNRDAPGIFRSNGIIHKSKIKVIKMLFVVVVMFAMSWLPLYVVNIRLKFFQQTDEHTRYILYNYIIPIAQWLGFSNSGINPIIYCLFSRKIRTRIKAMLTCNETEEFKRPFSRFSSTRYVSVDYTNGHVTLRTYGMEKERRCRSSRYQGNIYD